jgi:hypothetical protein
VVRAVRPARAQADAASEAAADTKSGRFGVARAARDTREVVDTKEARLAAVAPVVVDTQPMVVVVADTRAAAQAARDMAQVRKQHRGSSAAAPAEVAVPMESTVARSASVHPQVADRECAHRSYASARIGASLR